MREKILVPRYVQYIAVPLGLVLGLWLISAVRTIVIMFMIAFFIAFVLDRPVGLIMRRLRFPRLLAVLTVWLVILALLAGLIAFLVPNVISELNQLIEEFPVYSQKVESVSARLQAWFESLDIPFKPEITPEDVAGKLESAGTAIARRSLDFAQALFNIGLNFFLILVISIYMLIDAGHLRQACRLAVPENFRDDAVRLTGRIQKALGMYIRGQLLVSTIMGILGGLIAWYGGSGTYVFIIAVWVAVTEVIPLIGPFLGATPAVLLAWFTVSPTRAGVVALLFLAVQQLEGHILVPRVMGKSVGVHPLWVMFAVLSGASIAGIMGAIIAVPLVAVIKVAIDYYREEMVLEQWQRPLLEKTPVEEGK